MNGIVQHGFIAPNLTKSGIRFGATQADPNQPPNPAKQEPDSLIQRSESEVREAIQTTVEQLQTGTGNNASPEVVFQPPSQKKKPASDTEPTTQKSSNKKKGGKRFGKGVAALFMTAIGFFGVGSAIANPTPIIESAPIAIELTASAALAAAGVKTGVAKKKSDKSEGKPSAYLDLVRGPALILKDSQAILKRSEITITPIDRRGAQLDALNAQTHKVALLVVQISEMLQNAYQTKSNYKAIIDRERGGSLPDEKAVLNFISEQTVQQLDSKTIDELSFYEALTKMAEQVALETSLSGLPVYHFNADNLDVFGRHTGLPFEDKAALLNRQLSHAENYFQAILAKQELKMQYFEQSLLSIETELNKPEAAIKVDFLNSRKQSLTENYDFFRFNYLKAKSIIEPLLANITDFKQRLSVIAAHTKTASSESNLRSLQSEAQGTLAATEIEQLSELLLKQQDGIRQESSVAKQAVEALDEFLNQEQTSVGRK